MFIFMFVNVLINIYLLILMYVVSSIILQKITIFLNEVNNIIITYPIKVFSVFVIGIKKKKK
jgi:hypothetical protein